MSGTLWLPPDGGFALVDPLAQLPDPPDDPHLLRTFPGAPSHGRVTWTETAPGTWTFHTTLPHRYGAIGWTREGLLANGGWYPQPTTADTALPILAWDVRVALPDGPVGVVGDDADQGVVAWRGTADRAALAVVRRGRLTHLSGDTWDVDLVTPGRPRRVLVRELVAGLDAIASDDAPRAGAVVEGPLRRRLVRPGPDLAYLSDRAFRVTPPLQRFHRVAVARGIGAAFAPQADPFLRDVAGGIVGAHRAEALNGIDADQLLGAFRWIPQIHWLLASERMPFYADVLERTHPSDRLRDDLAEFLAPATPGTVVAAQLADGFGADAAAAFGDALLRGDDADGAAVAAGIPAGWVDRWRVPYPRQDYVLDVDKAAGKITVTRNAPDDAPAEVAVLRVDGEPVAHTFGPGPDSWTIDAAPKKVLLDPGGHLRQTSRLGDAWPERYTITLAAGVSAFNATRFQLYGSGVMTIRRSGDTHNLFSGVLYDSFVDLVGVRLSWLRQEGARKDGWARPHRFNVWVGASILNPNFSDTDGIQPALGSGVGYAWDTRRGSDFPLRGRRLGVTLGGGLVPGIDESWLHTGPYAVGVVSPHPRHALALTGEATLARSNVPHRKLALGGSGRMRSLPSLPACPATDDDGTPLSCQALADALVFGAAEYRVAPLRNVSVPLPLAWGSELQLTAGIEGVVATIDGALSQAVGLTTGVTGIADILGAEPYLGGITIGWPLAWSAGFQGVDHEGWPEIYLRWSQEF